MTETEGVIKFKLAHTERNITPPNGMESLVAWRNILWRLGLVGQDQGRYQGYGFGNVSIRVDATEHFLISGTQTGHLENPGIEHYAEVSEFDIETNSVTSCGEARPSSEALTHATLYELDRNIHAVLHVHSPEIWNAANALDIPETRGDVEYGTPAMAQEVERLFKETAVRQQGVFSMKGHQDGVVAFGPTTDAAGRILVNLLAKSLQLHNQGE